MWLTGYAYITLFSQKLGNLLKPSSLVKPHQQEFVAITSARVVEPGGYSPPLQFLTFACGHFTQIIDFFTASHAQQPPHHISVPLSLNLCIWEWSWQRDMACVLCTCECSLLYSSIPGGAIPLFFL